MKYSAIALQHSRLPGAAGWRVPGGKGGARRAGDTDGTLYPAAPGVHQPSQQQTCPYTHQPSNEVTP